MFSLIVANWRMLLIGILAAAAALCFKLWREEARAFAKFKVEVVAEGKAQKEQYETTVKDVSLAWAKELPLARSGAVTAYCRRNACGVLRGGGGEVDQAGSGEGTDGAGKEPVAAGTCSPDSGFISDAAEDALKVKKWQLWATENQLPVSK